MSVMSQELYECGRHGNHLYGMLCFGASFSGLDAAQATSLHLSWSLFFSLAISVGVGRIAFNLVPTADTWPVMGGCPSAHSAISSFQHWPGVGQPPKEMVRRFRCLEERGNSGRDLHFRRSRKQPQMERFLRADPEKDSESTASIRSMCHRQHHNQQNVSPLDHPRQIIHPCRHQSDIAETSRAAPVCFDRLESPPATPTRSCLGAGCSFSETK